MALFAIINPLSVPNPLIPGGVMEIKAATPLEAIQKIGVKDTIYIEPNSLAPHCSIVVGIPVDPIENSTNVTPYDIGYIVKVVE